MKMLIRIVLPALLVSQLIAVDLPIQAAAPGGPLLRVIPAGYATVLPQRGIVPTAGDRFIPQIANGTLAGGHFSFMLYSFINITDAPATFELRFYDSSGIALVVPMFQEGGLIVDAFGLGAMLPPRSSGVGASAPANVSPTSGYALLTSDPEGAIVVTGIFNNQVPGERLYQASVPLTTFFHKRFYLGFTNEAGFVSSLAVISVAAQTVTFIIRDGLGVESCRQSRFFQAFEHFPFLIGDFLTCALNTRALLEVEGDGIGGLSAVGFMAGDQGLGAFTTLPVWGPEL